MSNPHTAEATCLARTTLHAVQMYCSRLVVGLEVSGYSISALFISEVAQLLSGLACGIKTKSEEGIGYEAECQWPTADPAASP